MARNSIEIPAPPGAVWATLEDPFLYPEWVVGADHTVAADDRWPQPGSRFRVRLVGGAEDHTTVRALTPGERIVLDAASSRFGPARVTIEPSPEGTWVTMTEDPAGKFAPLRYVPPVHLPIKLRNVRAMQQLRDTVLEQAAKAS